MGFMHDVGIYWGYRRDRRDYVGRIMFFRLNVGFKLNWEFRNLGREGVPEPYGWEDLDTGNVFIGFFGTDLERNLWPLVCKEADGMFADQFVYHIGSFVEHGTSYEEFHVFTFNPSSRAHRNYIISEKAEISDRGIRGENRPLYIVRNTYIVRSLSVTLIDAAWTAADFQVAHQKQLDKVVHESHKYEPIYIEGRR